MESDLNKTPVKSDIDSEYDSPLSSFSVLRKSDSPSFVKWDFNVPLAPERIVKAAMKLKSDVRRERLKLNRNLRCKDKGRSTPNKNNKGSPLNQSYYSSVKQLRKTVDEILNNKVSISSSSEPSSSHTDINKCSHSNLEDNKENTDIPSIDINDDIFNDSVNDIFSECSQTVEDKFYNKPKKKLFQKEPEEMEPGCSLELINEIDDDLFLKVEF